MKSKHPLIHLTAFILSIFLLGSLLSACGSNGSTPTSSGPDIKIEGAWARPSPKMAGAGAAYMTFKNTGGEADTLIAGQTPAAEVIELHETLIDDNGVMKMRPKEGGIEVPAGGSAELHPGGMHIMLIKLAKPLEVGDVIPLTLTFEKSGEMTVDVPVAEQAPGK